MTTSKYIQDETISVSSGSVDSVQSKLNPNKVADVLAGLAKKYHSPYSAVVREYVSNGIDSHIKANQTKPVRVILPSEFNSNLIIQDFGIGMSYEDIVERYANYMMGDKESDVNQIGFFGIGSKSGFAIADQFVITAIKDGLKNIVIASKNELGTKYDFGIKNQKTDESDGVTVNIPIREDRIAVFHNRYEQTYYSVAGWSTDFVEVFGDESQEGFWNKRIPSSDEYVDNGSYFVAKKSKETLYRGGFILGGVYYSRSPFHLGLKSSIIPVFDVAELFPEESRENIRDSKRNEESFKKKAEEINELIKDQAIENLRKITTGRADRLKELSTYDDFDFGIIEIDGEKYSSGNRIHAKRKWASYRVNSFILNGKELKAVTFFAADKEGRDTVSPEIMENFTSEFDLSAVPSDYTELIEAYGIYKDKNVPVTFTDATIETIAPVSVGKVLNGSKIRLQISNVRKEFNRKARLSVKSDTEKAKIPDNTSVFVQEDGYYTKSILLAELLKKDDLKPIVLMKSKNDLSRSNNFTFIAPSANRKTLFEMLKSGLRDKIVGVDLSYSEISLMESKINFNSLSEDEKLFGAFVIKAFEEMSKDGFRKVSEINKDIFNVFFPKKETKKQKNSRARVPNIPAEMFKDIEINLETEDMKKFMNKTSTKLFFYIVNGGFGWANIDSTKEIRSIAKKIVKIVKNN